MDNKAQQLWCEIEEFECGASCEAKIRTEYREHLLDVSFNKLKFFQIITNNLLFLFLFLFFNKLFS